MIFPVSMLKRIYAKHFQSWLSSQQTSQASSVTYGGYFQRKRKCLRSAKCSTLKKMLSSAIAVSSSHILKKIYVWSNNLCNIEVKLYCVSHTCVMSECTHAHSVHLLPIEPCYFQEDNLLCRGPVWVSATSSDRSHHNWLAVRRSCRGWFTHFTHS
jgi:hypothetical protein